MSARVPKAVTTAAGTDAHRLAPAQLSRTSEPDLTVSTLLAQLVLDSPFLSRLNSKQLALMASGGQLIAVPRGATLTSIGADGDIFVILAGQLELRADDGTDPYGVALSGAVLGETCLGAASDDVLLLRVSAELLAELARP